MEKNQTDANSDTPEIPDSNASEPPEWFTITDLRQVKVITNELRARILGEFARKEQTAKQVAVQLGEPPTKLYRHVDALAEHGLIVPTREEQKRGTIQKFYRAVARRFRIDDACFPGDASSSDSKQSLIFSLLDSISHDMTSTLNSRQEHYAAALSSLATLTEEQIEEVGERIFESVSSIVESVESSDRPNSNSNEYRISIVIAPASPARLDDEEEDED